MSAISTQDLLFAHAALCETARQRTAIDKLFAHRLCDVINNFQEELRACLKPSHADFHVVVNATGYCHVEPIGGWD